MMFRPSKWSLFLPAAAVTLSGLLVSAAPPPAKPPGRSIELSDAPSSEVVTNLNQLITKKDGLRQLEDDLSRPFQTFSPKSSLDPMIAPPVQASRPVIPSKRVKDLLDRKKNLGFLSPEDFSADTTAQEIFKIPDYDDNGQEKKNASVLERYFDRIDKKRTKAGLNDPSEEKGFGRKQTDRFDNPDDAEESELLKGLNASESDLKKMFAPPEKNGAVPSFKPVVGDFFGMDFQPPSREERDIRKQKMNDYGNMIGLDSLAQPANPLDSAMPVRGNSWSEIYTPVRNPFALPSGSIAQPVISSPASGLPDPYAAQPVGQLPASSLREAPRALPSAVDFPRRKF
jgi:hypothetical protein